MGQATKKNVEAAMIFFQKSAEKGFSDSQYNLGQYYMDAIESWEGIVRDEKEAVKWYTMAAQQGHVNAQYNLGQYYMGVLHNDLAVSVDVEKALHWYNLSAKHASESQYALGVIYYEGTSVPKDLSKAYKWFVSASEAGDADAKTNLAIMYINGEFVEEDLDTAFSLLKEAAQLNESKAQYLTGLFYKGGITVAKDLEKAYFWIALADLNNVVFDSVAELDDIESILGKETTKIIWSQAKNHYEEMTSSG